MIKLYLLIYATSYCYQLKFIVMFSLLRDFTGNTYCKTDVIVKILLTAVDNDIAQSLPRDSDVICK